MTENLNVVVSVKEDIFLLLFGTIASVDGALDGVSVVEHVGVVEGWHVGLEGLFEGGLVWSSVLGVDGVASQNPGTLVLGGAITGVAAVDEGEALVVGIDDVVVAPSVAEEGDGKLAFSRLTAELGLAFEEGSWLELLLEVIALLIGVEDFDKGLIPHGVVGSDAVHFLGPEGLTERRPELVPAAEILR